MRIRLSYTDTHLSPLHASRGRYTRRSGGESAIATAARSLHLSPGKRHPLMADGDDSLEAGSRFWPRSAHHQGKGRGRMHF